MYKALTLILVSLGSTFAWEYDAREKLLKLPIRPVAGQLHDGTIVAVDDTGRLQQTAENITYSLPMNEVDKYFFGVEVGFGIPTVNGTLLLVNDNSDVVIPGRDCPDCGNANNFYDPLASTTYVEVMNVTMDIFGGTANVTIGKDLVCLGGAESDGNSTGGLCLTNTNFTMVNELDYTNRSFSIHDFSLDGTFGMGRPNISIPVLDQTNFLARACNAGLLNSTTWSYSTASSYDKPGTILIGGFN